MAERTVDARGLLCPKPLIMTKKALKEDSGDFRVILDNRTSFENVSRFLADNGVSHETAEDGNEFTIRVAGFSGELGNPDAEAYCPLPSAAPAADASGGNPEGRPGKTGPVFCFRTDRMGEGSDELGKILIQACCNTLGELEPLPSALVFYNAGVKLALDDSPVAGSLKDLEEAGVKILVCGTCADYFGVKDRVAAGIVSNMYDILDCLAGAAHVVSP